MNKPLRALLSSLFLFSAVLLFPTETHAQGQALSEIYSETPTAVPSMTPTRTPWPTSTPRPTVTPTPNDYPPILEYSISYNGKPSIRQRNWQHSSLNVKHGDHVVFTSKGKDPERQPVKFQMNRIPFNGSASVEEFPDQGEATLTITFDVPQRFCNSTNWLLFDVISSSYHLNQSGYFYITNYNKDNADNNDIIVTQGFGGESLLQVRNTDPERGILTNITQSFRTVSESFAAQIGGEGRGAYVSPGDINGDGINDLVISFGPVKATAEVPLPNIIIPRDGKTREIIGNSFMAFPKGNTKAIHYNLGDIRTTVGNFTGTAPLQIATAQGLGGNGVVRLFQYTGEPAPNAYKIIGQFDGLAGKAKTNNANGGINLAAGDVDGDGLDELIVGQTYSETSQSIFHILDIDSNGRIAKRTGYVAFPASYRSRGAGVCTTVGDLNGDGINELIAGGEMPPTNMDYYSSFISILHWNSETGVFLDFNSPRWKAIGVLEYSYNPSGVITLISGEFNNCDLDGDELAIGTGALVELKSGQILHTLSPRYSYVVIKKIRYDLNKQYSLGYADFIGGFLAFLPPYNPTSGAVHITTGRMH